jgi:CO/xanthine dehydrogenase FAD-binding subunit
MKPAPFRYVAPSSLAEVLDALASEDDSRVLAGGQSLLPLMAFRLALPELLVDLRNVASLREVRAGDDGMQVGAMVSQTSLLADAATHPLIREALPLIAHPQIRNRGTVGGSLAHADPSAELPAVAVALGAALQVHGSDGQRSIAVADFFDSYYTTTMEPGEVLEWVQFPAPQPREGSAILEVARRPGDFAMAGVAVRVVLDEAGVVSDAAVVPFAVGQRPERSVAAEQLLVGRTPTQAVVTDAARAGAADTDPPSDMHASGRYRRHALTVLTERALTQAATRALAS